MCGRRNSTVCTPEMASAAAGEMIRSQNKAWKIVVERIEGQADV